MIKSLNDIGINTTNLPIEFILGLNILAIAHYLFIQSLLITSLFIQQIHLIRVF